MIDERQELHRALSFVTDAEVITGTRSIKYGETGVDVWEYGLTVIAPDGDAEYFDELLDGAGRKALELDRSLNGTVVDVRVDKAVGPRQLPDGRLSVEFIVHVQKES